MGVTSGLSATHVRVVAGSSSRASPGAAFARPAARSLPAASSREFCAGVAPMGLAASRAGPARAERPGRAPVPVLAAAEKMTVAITGATGMVGSRLVTKLASQGHAVRVLTRNPRAAEVKLNYPGVKCFGPNDWASAISGCTGVVNLAGEPIASRWDDELKVKIKTSRVECTKKVVAAINACSADNRPKVLVSASAVGFYGPSLTASFTEESASGNDYLAEVCREWEGEAGKAEDVRVVIPRIGIVLSKDGGALAKMIPVFSLFSGGPLGSGKQWMSWIHREDLVGLMVEMLQDEKFSGVYNATAPNPVRMSELCTALGDQMGRPSWLPVPDFALQTLLGEGASVVLDGQKVLPIRSQEAGYKFKFSDVKAAVSNILR